MRLSDECRFKDGYAQLKDHIDVGGGFEEFHQADYVRMLNHRHYLNLRLKAFHRTRFLLDHFRRVLFSVLFARAQIDSCKGASASD